jgi:hypothetical protein
MSLDLAVRLDWVVVMNLDLVVWLDWVVAMNLDLVVWLDWVVVMNLDLVVWLDWVVVMNLDLNGLIRLDGYDELNQECLMLQQVGQPFFAGNIARKLIYI